LLLVISFAALGYAGSQKPEGIPVRIGQAATLYYFLHFLVLVPYLSRKEKTCTPPASISDDACCKH
jgi:quinol-cytochrome oxidoreductase complex cytochrome b subunit